MANAKNHNPSIKSITVNDGNDGGCGGGAKSGGGGTGNLPISQRMLMVENTAFIIVSVFI